MTSPRPRGPYAKGRERRQEILRVALEAYAESGSRGVALKDIAARAGVTEAGLLHHFGSKEALLSAVLQARDAAAFEAFGTTVDAEQIRRLVDYNSTTPGLVRLFVDVAAAASRPEHSAHEEFRQRYRRILDNCTRSFSEQLRSGPAPAEDPATGHTAWMSRILVAAMDGLQVQWLLDPTVDMSADLTRLLRALMALAAEPPGTPAPPGAAGCEAAPEPA